MDLLLPVECKIFNARAPDILKPVPTYQIPYPSNVTINRKTIFQQSDIYTNTNTNTELWNFYSDGSCMPNPGPGGSGYYSDNFIKESNMDIINHDTTIDYSELNGIYLTYRDTVDKIIQCANK